MRCCSAMSATNRRRCSTGSSELVERVRELDPTTVEFEPLGDPRIVGIEARERRLARGVGVKDGRASDSQIGLDPLAEEPAEDIRPAVVRRDAEARAPSPAKRRSRRRAGRRSAGCRKYRLRRSA